MQNIIDFRIPNIEQSLYIYKPRNFRKITLSQTPKFFLTTLCGSKSLRISPEYFNIISDKNTQGLYR
jgi:hypothetical protein